MKVSFSIYLNKLIILITFGVMVSHPTFAQNVKHLEREVYKIVRNETNIRLQDFPLMTIAVIDGENIEYLFFNKGSLVNNYESQKFHIYEIGEITQIFTSYLFYHLTLGGKISASDSINSYIPLNKNPLQDLSLNNLLMNTTGLPNKILKDVFDEDIADNEINSIEHILDLYKNPIVKFGSHSFNNYDYSILGYILNKVSRSTYLDKLNAFLPTETKLMRIQTSDKKLLQGHNRIGNAVSPLEEDIFYPANGIKSSIEDLSKFIQFLVLDSTNINYFNFVMEDSVENSRLNYVQRHRGWNSVEVNKNNKVLLQQGKTDGFTSFVAIYPRGKKAVVLLTNSSNTTEGLGFFILRMVSNYWKTN